MQRWKIITPLALATVISIAYFSGGPRVPMDDDNTSALALSENASENALEQKEGGFGADIDLGNGVILKDPEALGVEGRPLIMDVTITNNSSKTLDISSFTIIQSAFDSDDSLSCFDVFEEASAVNGVPADPLIPAGKSVSFKWAIVCPTSAGDKLHLTFTVTGSEEVTLDSTVK
jgi:hypothetical protein